jgi:hypothetical protein
VAFATHSPADILRYALASRGVGSNPVTAPNQDWPIYANSEPDLPDNVITVYDTDGDNSGRTMVDGVMQGWDGVQVRVRSMSPRVGREKADEVARVLAEGIYRDAVTIEGVNYLLQNLSKVSNVLPLQRDTPNTKRSLFTINAQQVSGRV